MKRHEPQKLLTFRKLMVAVALAAATSVASAETIFESGTLGQTGIPLSDVTDQTIPGTNVNASVFSGVRFQLGQPAVTTQVGGHFVAGGSGTFFGAIVELDNESDFPDSEDFSTPDFLGSTLLTFPVPSDEVFGNLALTLDPGWYALVFGSGLFGATASGVTVRNGIDIGDPTYIGLQPGSVFGWVNRLASVNRRYVVKGQIVPEVSSFALAALASLLSLIRHRSR